MSEEGFGDNLQELPWSRSCLQPPSILLRYSLLALQSCFCRAYGTYGTSAASQPLLF